METLILLIDGNNLAHFLYTNLVSRQKMTATDSLRLIDHLASYARTYAGQVEVELCLDKSPGVLPEDSPALRVTNLRLFSAEYPQTGDDLVIERFWFHHLSGRGCLVISNDEEILEAVSAAAGAWLRVSDFVRRPGIKDPVMRDPDDLPLVTPPVPHPEADHHPLSASIYYKIHQDPRLNRRGAEVRKPVVPTARKDAATRPTCCEEPLGKKKQAVEPPEIEREAVETGQPPVDSPSSELSGEPGGKNATSRMDEPYYFLNLEAWPVSEGARFLIKSFCEQHKSEVQDLLDLLDPQTVTHRDLRELAELLLLTCGDEPDFAQRGALLARVRLALLQARGEPLSLSEIAERTGLKALGLRGKIKAKAGVWVEIL